MAIILKNIHTNSVPISDLGIELAIGESRQLYLDESDFEFSLAEIQSSISLYTAIDNSLIIINDGTQDLSKASSLNVATGVSLEDVEEGSLSENEHENLDTLVHDIKENCYIETNRTGSFIDSLIYWKTDSKLEKIREIIFTRDVNKWITSYVVKQYETGVLSQTMTYTITRDLNKFIQSVEGVLS